MLVVTDLSGKKLDKVSWSKLTRHLPMGGVAVMHLKGKNDPLIVKRDKDLEQHKRQNKTETLAKVVVYGKGEYAQPENTAATA